MRAEMYRHKVLPCEDLLDDQSHATEDRPGCGATIPIVAEMSVDTSSNRWLRCWTQHSPTNYSMLLFRTLNQDTNEPNHNGDYIAHLLRDELMPVRRAVNGCFPCGVKWYKAGIEHPKWGTPGVCNFIDARTQWIDQAVQQAVKEGVCQVVVIAAGFDTRAYRLHQPNVKFWEVDLLWASEKKQALIQKILPDRYKHPRPHYVAADLSRTKLSEVLACSGFDPAQPTMFTCEGLLYYLPPAAVSEFFADIGSIAALGSSLYFDFLQSNALEGRCLPRGYAVTAQAVANKGEPFLSGFEPKPQSLRAVLAPHGLELSELFKPKDLAAKLLPHLKWSDEEPPILSFYGFAAAKRVTTCGDTDRGMLIAPKAASAER